MSSSVSVEQNVDLWQTTVGINPWVLGRDKSLYGEDADVFRPERWLQYSEEQLKVLGKSAP